jgi:peptidoglycan/xylan/chitin deacetylase (PgdA/CDA1 family)
MEVTTPDFAWQLSWLQDHREVVDLEAAVGRWEDDDADSLVVLTFDDGYQDTFITAFPLMAERGLPFTLYLATEMIDSGEVREGAAPIEWGQVETMMATGLVTIGSHTHTHRDMREVDRESALEELERSDRIIEERLGVVPRHFAYPWGYWAPETDEVVRSRYATAVLGAPRGRVDFDAHQIHRFPVQLSDATRWFRSRLRGGLLAEERVRRRLRGYRGP